MPIGANIADVGAGSLRELIAFDERIDIDDGAGNTTGAFVERFRRYGAFLALKGTEVVMASRLEGKQPYVVTVRLDERTRAVTPDWRIRDVRTGVAYAITTHVPRPRKDYIDLTCIEGVADTQVV
jgi:head-tail adaptor